MKLKVGTGLLCLILVLGLATAAIAHEYTYEPSEMKDELVDPKIPESWFHTPKLASEMGITEFNQSPMLDERVASGELPPVEERLPKDPPVIEPYDHNIGKYGGTFNLVTDSFDAGARRIMGHYPTDKAMRFTPSVVNDYTTPWMVEDFEYSNDYKEITLHLREGLKWSDGEPLDADDYHFWFEKYYQNEELTPTDPEMVPLSDVTSEDPYTVTFHYQEPYPNADIGRFAREMTGSMRLTPEHFMRQFHKDIVGEEEVEEAMEVTGHADWREFWQYMISESQFHPEGKQRPMIRAYVAVERTTDSIIYERNPYYPFVDSEGNQLPYIDRVRLNVLSSNEMVLAKVVTGGVDWEFRNLQIKDLPVIKRNEEKEDYRTNFITTNMAAHANIQPNLTHKDPQMRAIFQDDRFRKAISLAVNREEINDKYYLGTANPSQQTVAMSSEYYKEEYDRAYADYNPEKAKELLDEMGMIDRNGDGIREMPEGTMTTFKGEEVELDGGNFEPILMIQSSNPMPVFEIVQKNLSDIGINIRIDEIGGSLFYERVMGNNHDMICFRKGSSVHAYTPLSSVYTPFSKWVRWNTSDGEAGEEPPENMKQLIEWSNTYNSTTDPEVRDEAARKILESQAENIWTIGFAKDIPRIVVNKNRIKNHPHKGVDTHDHAGVFRPFQFYIDEEE